MIIDETDDYAVIVPDYLINSDDNELYKDGNEIIGYERSSDGSENINSDQPDYSDVLLSIDTNLQSAQDDLDQILINQALILSGQEELHNDLNVLNENLCVCTGLMFSIVVYLLFKIAFGIFNKVLGLGSC